MARLKKGIHGPLKGKIANVVYTTWREIEVVKTAPVRTAPPTEKELINQFVFKLTNDWLSPITPLLRIGFKNYTPNNQGFTAAKSYLTKNALTKDGYNSSIDPALMKVSFGELPLPENIQVELNAEKQLVFSWDTALGPGQSALDQALLLAYDVEHKKPQMLLGGKFRQEATASLSMEHIQPGEYHVYIAFVAADRERQSDSRYLGMVTIIE